MDRDELREKIKAIIIEAREEDHHGNLLIYSDEATDSILSLPSLREALEKAEKWDRVINTLEVCQDCPLRYRCVDGCVVEELVDALEGKEVK